jgi:hypothetical protein
MDLSNSKIGIETASKSNSKRSMNEIINDFYDYMVVQNREVFLNEIRENVVSSPSDKHILDLIANIQERPYVYIKKNGRFTLLKLSSQKRDPKRHFTQIGDIIQDIENQHKLILDEIQKKKEQNQGPKTNEYGLILENYKQLFNSTREKLLKLKDRKEI